MVGTLQRHLKYFGLVDDGGKATTFSEWATLAQDRAGWLKLVAKVPFGIGKPQLRPPQCDTRVMPEEKRRFLARRAQETEQRRLNSFHFREGGVKTSSPLRTSYLRF